MHWKKRFRLRLAHNSRKHVLLKLLLPCHLKAKPKLMKSYTYLITISYCDGDAFHRGSKASALM